MAPGLVSRAAASQCQPSAVLFAGSRPRVLAACGYGGAAAPAQVDAMPGVREAAAGAGRSGLL